MVILADKDVISKGFSHSHDRVSREIRNMLYNEESGFCINANLLDKLEGEIEDEDLFQAFVREVMDNQRVVAEKSDPSKPYEHQVADIYNKSQVPCLIPLTLKRGNPLSVLITNCVVLAESQKCNRHWIALELLSKNHCKVDYSDFSTNIEIETFFNDVIGIQNKVKRIRIFNREQDAKFIELLKGGYIEYYTLLFGGARNRHEHLEILKDLKKELGGKLRMFSTGNARILHERKILLDDLIISIDNSLQNINIKEPTWEISISYDPIKSCSWGDKCSKFRRVS